MKNQNSAKMEVENNDEGPLEDPFKSTKDSPNVIIDTSSPRSFNAEQRDIIRQMYSKRNSQPVESISNKDSNLRLWRK